MQKIAADSVSGCAFFGVAASTQDLEQVRGWLESAAPKVHDYFKPMGGRALQREATCIVLVWGAETEKAGQTHGGAETWVAAKGYLGLIHHLAPSAFEPGGRTLAGEPRDDTSHQRVLVHEYAAFLLDLATRNKAAGWRLQSAPEWFSQGYKEYLGATLSTEHARKVTLDLYRASTCTEPARITTDFDKVTNVYMDGPTLLMFMHDEFGAERLMRLLASPETEFWSAVRATLAVSRHDLFTRWLAWRVRRCGR